MLTNEQLHLNTHVTFDVIDEFFRDDLIAKGVEVMDGDPLGWDWGLDI
jgi:hypothetical protein